MTEARPGASSPRRTAVAPVAVVGGPLQVLFVEDSEDDAALVVRQLRQAGYILNWERVDTAPAMATALRAQVWDLIVCDFSMPQFDAWGALEVLRQSGLDLPFVIVSGTIGEDTAVQAMKGGAHDYLLKGNLTRLPAAVERELREAIVRRERDRVEEELRDRDRRLRLVVEQAPLLLWTTDAELRFTSFEGGASGRADGTDSRPLGMALQAYFQMTVPGSSLVASHRRALGGDSVAYEFNWRALTFQGRAEPLRDQTGRIVGVISVGLDVTERKRAQEKIDRQLQRLGALHTIDMAITGGVELTRALGVVLEQALGGLRVDAADILLLNPHTQELSFAAERGFLTLALRYTRLRLGECYAGRAALERRIIDVPNLVGYPGQLARSPLLPEEQFVAYCAAPLIAKGQVRGVLEVFQRRPAARDNEWLEFLDALAVQAAIAIDNASLFADVQRANVELTLAYDTTLEGWAQALDLRDQATEGHSRRVTEMAVRLGRALGVGEAELVHMRRGALLHDIGKIAIPDHILRKPGSLASDEEQLMRQHPVRAYTLLSPIAYLRPALDIPYCHHEKWDGSGYPRGLRGEQIPLAARIFAIVDVWDALRSDRPYRPAWGRDRALAHIREQAGSHFDPRVVEVFLEIADVFDKLLPSGPTRP